MHRLSALILAAGLVVALPAASLAQSYPDTIALPDGFAPEGIAVGNGHTFFAGSLAGGGLYRGDLRTGEGVVIAPSDGRTLVGMDTDAHGRVWVAGGPDGTGYVFDGGSGVTLATFAFTAEPSFVNDVVVTDDAAWFTDSFRPIVYRVAIGPGGTIGSASEVDLTGKIAFVPGDFNLNGIDATPDGERLVLVSSAAAELYVMDAPTEAVAPISLGAALPFGDGILLHGKTLYVVQNQLNQIAVVALAPDLASGVVTGVLTHDGFDVPTTIARFGRTLYAVNARFNTPVTPDTPYWVTAVSR